jgi:hypothetical protein
MVWLSRERETRAGKATVPLFGSRSSWSAVRSRMKQLRRALPIGVRKRLAPVDDVV